MPEAGPSVIHVGRGELKAIPPRPTPRHGARRQSIHKDPSKMSIFSRTRDIVAANLTDLLDRAEDPAKMIRMVVLEMEETLMELRSGQARTASDRARMQAQVVRVEALEGEWSAKAELALAKGREDLAKAALVEKHKAGQLARELEAEIAMLDSKIEAAEADAARLEGKLHDARARQAAIAARIGAAGRPGDGYGDTGLEQAFARFEMLERRVELAESRAGAPALSAPALDEEIASLRSSDRADAELAAMRARLSHDNQTN
jgi:phage shock protein A